MHAMKGLALISLISIVIYVFGSSQNVDYQIHSNNDLGEIHQLLLKGVRRFKFDPHYIALPHKSCSRMLRYDRKDSQQKDVDDDFGLKNCFLLSHDRPSQLVEYNTLNELIDYFVSEQFKHYVSNDYVSVALCFKSAPDLCQENSAGFKRWLREVDDFYERATSLLPSNIEIILDGDGKPFGCLNGKWPAWKSVWINEDPNPEAFSSNSKENDNYRFQILNNPENLTDWAYLAQAEVNYGKFSNSSYPYQLWEPDAQEVMLQYKSIYERGAYHAPGFHFAINSDVAMFRIFTSYSNNNTNNYNNNEVRTPVGINIDLNTQGVDGKRPVITAIYVNANGDNQNLLAIYTASTITSTNLYFTSMNIDRARYQVELPAKDLLASEDIVSALGMDAESSYLLRAITLNYANNILLCTNLGKILIASVDQGEDGTVTALYSKSSAFSVNEFIRGEILDIILLPETFCEDDYCMMAISQEKGQNTFSLTTFSLERDFSQVSFIQASSVNAVSGATDSARISLVNSSEVVVFASTDNKVYATTWTWNLQSTGRNDDASLAVKWTLLTVGKHIDISLAELTSEDQALMLVTDYGYCYNSHKHNTRALPRVCTSTPVATASTLDYSIGLLCDWLAVIKSSDGTLDHFSLSVCHPRILHGSYDLGSRPTIYLLGNNTSATNSMNTMFVELHEGFSTASGDKDIGECGAPLTREGLVLDSFAVNEWLQTLINTQ